MFRAFLTYLAAVAVLTVILGLLAFALYTGYGRYAPPMFTTRVRGAPVPTPAATEGMAAAARPSPAPNAPAPAPAASPAPVPAPAQPLEPVAVDAVATAAAPVPSAVGEDGPPAAAVTPIFNPSDGPPPDGTIQLIDLRMKSGEWPQALALCRQTLKNEPGRLDVRVRYAAILSLIGNDNDAYREAAVVLAERPDDYRANLLLAGVMLRRGLPSLAVTYARKAVAAAPALPECHSLLAQTLLGEGSVDEARAVLEKLVMTRPDDAEILMTLGNAYARSGNTNRAVAVYEKVEELQPDSPAPDLALGELNIVANRHEAAIESYRRVLAKAPAHPVALNNLATLLFEERGDAEEAMRLASQAWQLYPDSPQIADTLGWLYAHAKDYAKATVLLGFAVRREPRDPTMRYHLAVVLHARGLVEEADRQLTAALAGGEAFRDAAAAHALQERIRSGETPEAPPTAATNAPATP